MMTDVRTVAGAEMVVDLEGRGWDDTDSHDVGIVGKARGYRV